MKNLCQEVILLIVLTLITSSLVFAGEKPREVIVVFKTHFDIGYTDWADNIKYNYAGSMVEGALSIIDSSRQMPAHQQFKWIVAGWPMKEMLTKSEPPVKQKIENALRDQHFTVHGLPFTFETEASDVESLVRSLTYSSEINRKAGLPLPIDAKQTDVPSHSWALPTILTNAGIRFLHIGCNPASRSPGLPLLFWWEGPDKSRLMTMYFEPYYGTTPAPPEGWPFKTWLAIVHTNDNVGAPAYEEFKKAIREVEEKNPGARVRTGSMADFYNAIMEEDPKLPVIRGDMPDTWIHGYMSMPREVKSSRRLSVDIPNLENLNTLMPTWGGKSDHNLGELTGNAMEKIHLFNEHTFGLAMSHGHSGYWAYNHDFENLRARGFYKTIEFSWDEKALHVKNAAQMVIPAVSRKMKELALSVNHQGTRIVVYNPLPWERSGIVTVKTLTDLKKALKNVATGEIVPYSKDQSIVSFASGNIPPMGYSTFVPVDEAPAHEEFLPFYKGELNILENAYFRIKIDPVNGTIESLFDKQQNREMVAPGSEWKFGQYVNERFSKTMTDQYATDYIKAGWNWAYAELGRINLTDDPYRRLSGNRPEIVYSSDEVSASAAIHFNPDGENLHKYSQILTLYRDKPMVELIWSINGKPADAWPEAGWITFNFDVSNPEFRLGRPGAVVNPVTDYIKGSNLDYCFLHGGIAVIDKSGNGYGVMSPDVPGMSLDRPGLWKYSTDFVPGKANVFFNLYNNQWSTNFTEWIEGSWSARFYLWSITGYSNEKSLVTPSEELRNPLLATCVSGPPGTLPAMSEGIRLSRKGVTVTAFLPDADERGTILRLWEQAGVSGKVDVRLPSGFTFSKAQPVNLRGENQGDPVHVFNGIFTIDLGEYAPASYILSE
jgi:alpha-mannosidase